MADHNLDPSFFPLRENGDTFKAGMAYSSLLLDKVHAAVYTCDKSGILTSYNKASVKLWGHEPEIGKDTWFDVWTIYNQSGDPLDRNNCPMSFCLKDGVSIEGEILVRCMDGSFKNVLVYPIPLLDDGGNIEGAINTLIDITKQKSYDEKQSILASIIESSEDAIISKTLQGIITSWNNGAKRIFGYDETEVVGKSIEVLIPLERRSEEFEILEQLKKGNRVSHFETIRVTKLGKRIPISLSISPVKDEKGNVIGASKIARDISLQKQVEEANFEHAKRLEILNSIGKMISEKLDVNDVLQKVTDATTKITGAEFGVCYYNNFNANGDNLVMFTHSGAIKEDLEALTKTNAVFFNPKFSSKVIIRLADITKDPGYNKDELFYGKGNGNLTIKSYLAVPIISKSDKVLGGLFFGHSEAGKFTFEHESIAISIASQAAVALDNAKLFEEVRTLSLKKDQFIARASHEIKTPLTSVHGYLQILDRNIDDAKNKMFLNKTLNQLSKLNNLITDLFDLSKINIGKMQLNMERMDLKKLISDVIENYQVVANHTHQIIFEQNDGEFLIEGNKQSLEQVLRNLFNNAIKYSPNKEKVIVTLDADKNEICVHVRDFGVGVSIEQQQQIFNQFYRADGLSANISGLGLGLHICKEIIDAHEGRIWVASELNEGSQFSFALPTII